MKRYFFIFAGLLFFIASVFVIDRRLWLIDDRDHPDGALVLDQLSSSKAAGTSSINVIPVAGGNWLALCLVGPSESPSDTLRAFARGRGIRISTLQRFRSWFYVGSVPKDELALVFVTGTNTVRSRRIPNVTDNPNFRRACAVRNDAGLNWK